jgi:anti-anti-sigma factor
MPSPRPLTKQSPKVVGLEEHDVHQGFAVKVLAQLRIAMSCPSPATARVAVVGEVDLATASVLRGRLLRVLHDQTPAVLDVDLAGVTFLDCAGIGALVEVRDAAVQAGRQMRVTHPQPIVHRVLETMGLLELLTAPIDQPETVTTESEHPSGTGSAPATVTQPPATMVAA